MDDIKPYHPGTLTDYIRLYRLSKNRQAVILNGASGIGQRYRDLIFAIILRRLDFRRAKPTRVLIHDATWEQTSSSLVTRYPFLRPVMKTVARGLISLLDGPNVFYAVLSSDEVKSFPVNWGVAPSRVLFQPWVSTLFDMRDIATSQGDYLFAGGNSLRDYPLLENAIAGTTIRTIVASAWRPTAENKRLQARTETHQEFFRLMANSRAVVVPLRTSIRSAGQQTYLNAMMLGKPVIVTEAPGVHDYISNGVTGIIVPSTVDALRAALLHVMDPRNAGFYTVMASNAREAARRFDEDHYRRCLLLNAGVRLAE